MNLVASVHQAAREIGNERLRPATLRLPDRPRRAGRRSRPSSRDHLEREVARRIDPQHLVGNPSPPAATDLRRPRRDRRSRSARQPPRGWRTRRTSRRRSSRTGSHGQRASGTLFGQTMTTQPPGLQTRSISARPASPPCPGAGVSAEHATTRSAQASLTGRSSKKPWITPGAVPVIRSRELLIQDLAQRPGGFDRHDLARAPDELQRQPARARSHLDDPVDVVAAATRARRDGAARR